MTRTQCILVTVVLGAGLLFTVTDVRDALAAGVDRRSAYERVRDYELVKHTKRIARLDVLEQLCEKQRVPRLLRWIEDVRRREDSRFAIQMQRIATARHQTWFARHYNEGE